MKALLMGLLALVLGAGGLFAAGPLGDEPTSDRTIPLTFEPSSSTRPSSSTTTTTTTTTTATTETVEDVRGPCDEPEHVNDPRCTGGVADDDDGRGRNSGPGGDDSGGDDSGSGSSGHGGSGDRSGSNSGSG
jgi:hypothetical protein